MREFLTEQRLSKITNTLRARQYSLHVVIENVHDPHNVSAIFRTCDAAGIPAVSLIYTKEEFPSISKVSSASASKWIEKNKYKRVEECYSALREKGFKIFASKLEPEASNLYDLDLTEKTAFVLGNEHRGVSDEAAEQADGIYYIPMYGMIQSLNVSVANAVTVYEAQRQRRDKGMYDSPELAKNELENKIDEWSEK